MLREAYAEADPRSLALFRIALGLVVSMTALGRWGDVSEHLSDEGWLPRSAAFGGATPLSLLRYLGAPGAVKAFLAAGAVVGACLSVGLWTKWMQWLALAFVVSLNARNTTIENGGYVALIWLSLLSAFLPLGRFFSFDALRRAPEREQRRQRPVVSLAVAALVLQWGAIYWLNYAQKTGDTWRDGTALEYFLQQDQAVTALGIFVRERAPLSLLELATHAARFFEQAMALLLLLPFTSPLARSAGMSMALALHGAIAVLLDLGPFSWVMLCGWLLLLRGGTWDAWAARAPRLSGRIRLAADVLRARFGGERAARRARIPKSAGALAVAALIAVQLTELAVDNPAVPAWLRPDQRPAWVAAPVRALRLFQDWSLCAPDPPLVKRRLSVSVVTASGHRFDALAGATGQAWDEVHRRLADRPRLWPAFHEFARRRAARLAGGERLASISVELLEQPLARRGRPALPLRRIPISDDAAQTER